MYYTTLKKIRAHKPCEDGWKKLLAHLGKTMADDEPLALATILASNGLDDALWCLRAVGNIESEARLYIVWCARQVQHIMSDPRSIAALDVAERYAHGHATDKELTEAWVAASVASTAAWAEAWEAAWVASRVAASVEARDAAWMAARAEARDAQVAEFRRRFCKEDA